MIATAATAYLGNPAHVDPEEAFIASLSSCHMLTFLAIACKQRFVIDSYEDYWPMHHFFFGPLPLRGYWPPVGHSTGSIQEVPDFIGAP